jgi:hypothetical protein
MVLLKLIYYPLKNDDISKKINKYNKDNFFFQSLRI